MKFLKSLSKYIILGFGSISLCAILAGGTAGKIYQKEAIELYSKIRNELNKEENNDIFSQIKNLIKEIKNFDVTKTIDDLKLKFNEVKSFLGANPNNNNANNITSLITQLEEIKKNINDYNGSLSQQFTGFSIDQVKQKLDQAITELKTIENNTNEIIKQIDTNINNFEGPAKEYLDKDSPILNKVNNYTDQINNIYSNIANWMNKSTPENINSYYDLATTLMIAIPATILGVGILSSFCCWIKYNNIDGKLYSRNNEKGQKEAIDHIKKIVSKYPSVRRKM